MPYHGTRHGQSSPFCQWRVANGRRKHGNAASLPEETQRPFFRCLLLDAAQNNCQNCFGVLGTLLEPGYGKGNKHLRGYRVEFTNRF